MRRRRGTNPSAAEPGPAAAAPDLLSTPAQPPLGDLAAGPSHPLDLPLPGGSAAPRPAPGLASLMSLSGTLMTWGELMGQQQGAWSTPSSLMLDDPGASLAAALDPGRDHDAAAAVQGGDGGGGGAGVAGEPVHFPRGPGGLRPAHWDRAAGGAWPRRAAPVRAPPSSSFSSSGVAEGPAPPWDQAERRPQRTHRGSGFGADVGDVHAPLPASSFPPGQRAVGSLAALPPLPLTGHPGVDRTIRIRQLSLSQRRKQQQAAAQRAWATEASWHHDAAPLPRASSPPPPQPPPQEQEAPPRRARGRPRIHPPPSGAPSPAPPKRKEPPSGVATLVRVLGLTPAASTSPSPPRAPAPAPLHDPTPRRHALPGPALPPEGQSWLEEEEGEEEGNGGGRAGGALGTAAAARPDALLLRSAEARVRGLLSWQPNLARRQPRALEEKLEQLAATLQVPR